MTTQDIFLRAHTVAASQKERKNKKRKSTKRVDRQYTDRRMIML